MRPTPDLQAAKTELLAFLKQHGVAHVIVEYDGAGDSGQTEAITAHNASREEVSLTVEVAWPLIPWCDPVLTLRDAVDEFAWLILNRNHGGFYNNEGGYGELRIDVENGTAVLDHYDRFMDTTNSVASL